MYHLMPAHNYGFVTQVSDSQGHVWWSNPVYDYRGRVTQFTNGNGEVTNHTFHATRQTLESVRSRFLSTDFHHMSFKFDALGNLTERKDHFQDQYETFRYDNLNRLRRTALNASAQGGPDDLTYDALGNILTKNGVGTFTYTQANRPYQLTAAGTQITGSQYDANGNLTNQSRFGFNFQVEWTSFNKPATMYHGPTSGLLRNGSVFRYDAGGNRVAHIVSVDDTDIRKTLYIGGFEQSRVKDENENWVTDYTRIAISAPTGVVGTYDHKAAGTSAADNTRSYYHYDHLGTIVAVTGSWMTNTYSAYFGTNPAIQRYAYDAWGRERNPLNWNPQDDTYELPNHVDVHRGFTGHEMLRHLGLVHMNGRIYDPFSGRFLSPDPFVQSPGNLQNYNRYGYVLNNPLSYTDPSGYFFKKILGGIFGGAKKYWKVIVAVGLAALTGYGAMLWLKGIGWTSSLAIGAAAGAAAGFVGSFTGSLLHGGSMSQALGAGLVGALWGGLAGGAAGQIGSWAEGWKGAVEFKRALAHGISGGAIGQARDGNFFAGAFAGAASSWVSHGEFSSDWGDPQHIIAAAVVGSTAARIGGGSFENGAVTGAFQYLFNSRLSAAKRRNRERSAPLERSFLEKIHEQMRGVLSSDIDFLNAHPALRDAIFDGQSSVTFPYDAEGVRGEIYGAALKHFRTFEGLLPGGYHFQHGVLEGRGTATGVWMIDGSKTFVLGQDGLVASASMNYAVNADYSYVGEVRLTVRIPWYGDATGKWNPVRGNRSYRVEGQKVSVP